jgi:hypothetical protein
MIFRMMHFRPGKRVSYDGYEHIVDHVILSGIDLLVKLQQVKDPVNSERLYCEPTEFTTERYDR